jgi:hypothetical protein
VLTEEERNVLLRLLSGSSALMSAIRKFSTAKQQQMDASCADAMRSVPRQTELAADYAAKAEAYKLLTLDLERFASYPI